LEYAQRMRVVLHGASPFRKLFDGVVWLVGAAHPSRPELILLGGYRRPFPELGPDAPPVGVFILKLSSSGEVLWRRTAAETDPSRTLVSERELALGRNGSVALFTAAGGGGVEALFGSSASPSKV
jgi:hypothetical protein